MFCPYCDLLLSDLDDYAESHLSVHRRYFGKLAATRPRFERDPDEAEDLPPVEDEDRVPKGATAHVRGA